LGKENCTGWYMHVMANLLILEHELSTIPSVASNGTVDRNSGRIFVSFNSIDHQPIKELVCGPDCLSSGV